MRLIPVMTPMVALVLLAGCGTTSSVPGLRELGELSGLGPSDEERVAAVLDDVHSGMQAEKPSKVLAHVSRQYHDEEGRDYAAIEAYLNSFFKKYEKIRITRVAPRIVVQDGRARALETFGTVAEPENPRDDLPVNVQGQVTVFLEKSGGAWRIVEWGRIV